MEQRGEFKTFTTPNGIQVWVEETSKYKTTVIDLYIRRNLDEQATQIALIPPLLKRGSEAYPGMRAIEHKLENLYGAHFSADVEKIGENHLINLGLSLPNGTFIPGSPPLLKEGLAFLAELLLRPERENGGFRADYLTQEKENLKNYVAGLINEKGHYASESLIRTMCDGERYAIYEYGTIEALESIDSTQLYKTYRESLERCPIDIYISGEVDANEVQQLVESLFDFPRSTPMTIAPTDSTPIPTAVKEVREEQDVLQGKLCIGYRTYTTLADDDYLPFVWFNGILGGFSHSKLFKNVREKHSLAYYASSNFDKFKGVMMINSGIDGANYAKAVRVIKEQIDAMQQGDISTEEMDNTLAGLTNRLKSIEDSAGQKIAYLMQQNLGGRRDSLRDIMDQLATVTKDEIVAVSQKLKLDTIFFLCPQDTPLEA